MECANEWLQEIEDYKSQMTEYFTKCSAKLKEWYDNGGDRSDTYRVEYNKLMDEYDKYTRYLEGLHRSSLETQAAPGSDSQESRSSVLTSAASVVNSVPVPVASVPQTVSSYAQPKSLHSFMNPSINLAAAASYTQYYKEMIDYFNKLLKALESSNDPETSEEETENIEPKKLTKAQRKKLKKKSRRIADGPLENDDATKNSQPDSFVDPIKDPCADPQSVMQEYFLRYGRDGEWDWASWNNYINWIAQTNPQWHGIFTECSQNLGIDWNRMYANWSKSNGSMPFSSVSIFDSSDTSAESALDAATSDEDDIDDWSYCRTCDQPFQSERTFAIHLRGVKHMQNALEKARLKHPERFLAETDRQNAATLDEPSQEEKHMSWLRSQFTSEKKRELGLSGSFVCELCRIECPSEKALSMHLSGRKHRTNHDSVSRASDTSESSLSVSAGENAPGPPPCDHSSSQPCVEQSLSSLILPPLPEPAGPHVQAETGVSSHSPLEPSSPSRLCHDSSEAHPSQSTEQEALPEDVEVCNKPIKSSSNLLSRLISCSPKRLPSVVTQHRLFICMDSNRKQLALSSGAFAVVLSAIEALKASGQLRNSSVNLETPLNQANIQESRDVTKTFDNRLNALEGGHLETGDEVSPGMPENGNVKDLMELLSKFLLPNKGPSNGEAFSAPTEPKRICLSTPISTDSSANVRPVLLPTGHRSDDTCHSMGGPTSKSQSFSLVSSSYDQDCEDESISIASGALASSETSLLTSSISTMGNSTSTSMPKTLLPLPSDTASLASVSSVLVKPSGGEEIFDAYSLLERQEKEEREERQAKRQLSISSSSSSKLATAPKTRRLSALADLYGLNEPPPPPMVQQSTQQSSITSHSSCAPSSSISSGGQEFASAVQLTNSLGGYTSAATGSLASNVFFTSPTQHTSQSLQQQSQSHPPSQQQSSLSAFYPPCLLYYQQSMANPLLAAQAATISSTVPSTVITTAATTSSSFLPATSSPQAISTLYPPGLAYFPRMSSQQPLYSSFSVTSEPAPPGVQPN